MGKENVSSGSKQIKFGITPKLLLGILCPLIVVLAIMSVLLGIQSSNIVDEVMSGQLDAQADAAANQVESFFEHYYGVSESLGATQIIRDTVSEDVTGGFAANDQYENLLETLGLIQQNDAENITYAWVANLKTGELLQSDGTLFKSGDIDFPSRSWYQLVMDMKDTITTETYAGANGNGDTVTVASPVLNDGTIVGIVGIDINIQQMKQKYTTDEAEIG